jgi:hypothetical protein
MPIATFISRSDGIMILNKLERIWKEVAEAYFNPLFQLVSGGTQEIMKSE